MTDKLNIDELGKEFVESLEKVIDIRKSKRKDYGDTYRDDNYDFLLMQIQNKLKRIELRLKNDNFVGDSEKIYDNILDAIIYLHFLHINLVNNKNDTKATID